MKKTCILLLAGAVSAFPVFGAIQLDTPETFDTGLLDGWTAIGDASPAASEASVGGQTAVSIQFAAQGIPFPDQERVYAQAATTPNFAPNEDYYSQYMTIGGQLYAQFQFYSDTYLPDSLSLFFYSDVSGTGRTWAQNVSVSSLGWQNYSVLLNWSPTAWVPDGGYGYTEFNQDIMNVDRIGVWVFRNDSMNAQLYGFDNFQLHYVVPEPETYAMLAFALLSLGYTFRRRLSDSLDAMRSYLRV
jgi:hypothetical protein